MSQTPHGIRDLHEEATGRRFVNVYNAQCGHALQFIGLQDPPKPDCQCSDGIELELVSVYYDAEAAKARWSLARGTIKEPTAPKWVEGPDQAVFVNIDAAIENKATKTYCVSDRLWLVIRVDAPLLEWADIVEGYLSAARGKVSGLFDEVWVLLGDGDGDHVAKVTL